MLGKMKERGAKRRGVWRRKGRKGGGGYRGEGRRRGGMEKKRGRGEMEDAAQEGSVKLKYFDFARL